MKDFVISQDMKTQIYYLINNQFMYDTFIYYVDDATCKYDEKGYQKISYKNCNTDITIFFKNNKLCKSIGPVIDIKKKVLKKNTKWTHFRVWFYGNKATYYFSSYDLYTRETYDRNKDYSYDENVQKSFECFEYKCLKNSLFEFHKLYTPSIITLFSGEKIQKCWYINDTEYSYEEFKLLKLCLRVINNMKRKMWNKRLESYLYNDLTKIIIPYIL